MQGRRKGWSNLYTRITTYLCIECQASDYNGTMNPSDSACPIESGWVSILYDNVHVMLGILKRFNAQTLQDIALGDSFYTFLPIKQLGLKDKRALDFSFQRPK